MMTMVTEKDKVLDAFFASVLNVKTSTQESQDPEIQRKPRSRLSGESDFLRLLATGCHCYTIRCNCQAW